MVEQDAQNYTLAPHIRVYTNSNRSQLVNYYYGCYDPLQYPLLFPFGKNGWHCGIQKVEPLGASSSRQKYCENEQLPSITNMTTIDGFLDIEAEVMQKENVKEIVSPVVNVIVINFKCEMMKI